LRRDSHPLGWCGVVWGAAARARPSSVLVDSTARAKPVLRGVRWSAAVRAARAEPVLRVGARGIRRMLCCRSRQAKGVTVPTAREYLKYRVVGKRGAGQRPAARGGGFYAHPRIIRSFCGDAPRTVFFSAGSQPLPLLISPRYIFYDLSRTQGLRPRRKTKRTVPFVFSSAACFVGSKKVDSINGLNKCLNRLVRQ